MKPDQGKPPAGITLKKLPEGGVELVAGPGRRAGQAAVSLHKPRMREFIFEVEGAEPGTGVFLGDAEGRHLGRLAFVRHRESGKMAFELDESMGERGRKSRSMLTRQPVPCAGGGNGFACSAAPGSSSAIRRATRSIGANPPRSTCRATGPVRKSDCTACRARNSASITLRSIAVRTLDAFTAIVPEGICKCVPAMAKIETIEAWQEL